VRQKRLLDTILVAEPWATHAAGRAGPARRHGTAFDFNRVMNSKNNDARVLIVENDDALRVMLFTVLRHQPLTVDTAMNGESAFAKVMSCDYALLLIDMNLPDDEATLFLRRFRDERPEATTFVIAVRDPRSEEPIDPGFADAVLNKPLEIDTLAELVRECACVVPPPDDPLPCPPSESEVRTKFDRSGSFYSN
jgi:CheY-like chemotaxis protein